MTAFILGAALIITIGATLAAINDAIEGRGRK